MKQLLHEQTRADFWQIWLTKVEGCEIVNNKIIERDDDRERLINHNED